MPEPQKKGKLTVAVDNTWPYRFDVIDVAKMFVDEAYQRPLSQFVRTIVDEFDPALIGVLILSQRPRGRHALMDGQTRWTALKQLGHVKAPSLVYEGLSRAQEADLFARFQVERKGIKPYFRWRAEAMAGKPRAKAILEVCTALGIEITPAVTQGEAPVWRRLGAVAAAERLFDAGGREFLERVLLILTSAWKPEDAPRAMRGQSMPFSGELINGLNYFLRQVPEADDDRLITRLAMTTPTEVVKRASALREGRGHGGGSPLYVADVIRTEYQRRVRS